MIPLDKYKLGYDVKLNELDFKLLMYMLKERWKFLIVFILLLLFAFMVGYFVGYSNAVVELNNYVIENEIGVCLNWTI